MLCESKGVGSAVAEKSDATPKHEKEDEAETKKEEETADAVGGRFETVGSPVDSINAFGCNLKG